MIAIISLIDTILSLYSWIIIASVILSWLVAFNVINRHNRIVDMIGEFLHRATEPVLAPIRRIMPNLGPVDLSPVVLLLLIFFLRTLLSRDIAPALY